MTPRIRRHRHLPVADPAGRFPFDNHGEGRSRGRWFPAPSPIAGNLGGGHWGRKTCSRPWRGSTQSAVRMIHGALCPDIGWRVVPVSDSAGSHGASRVFRGIDAVPRTCPRGSGRRLAPEKTLCSRESEFCRQGRERGGRIALPRPGYSCSETQGMESSGRRSPIGESPGRSHRISSSRRNQAPDSQRPPPTDRMGRAYPTVSPRPFWNTRASRSRSWASFRLDRSGVTFDGRRRSFHV